MSLEWLYNWGKAIWYGEEYRARAEAHFQDLLRRAATIARIHTQANLSIAHRSYPGQYPGMQTGQLERSVIAEVDPGTKSVRISTHLQYGYWLEYGTAGGRIIRARPGGWLRWWDRTGQVHFAKWVRQGKILPRPWMRRSANELIPILDRHFRTPVPM